MLGLFLFSLTLLSLNKPRPILAAVPFVLAICFKQMALYYAPAIFIYLLAVSIPRLTAPNIPLLVGLASAVLLTFALNFVPFTLPPLVLDALTQRDFVAAVNFQNWRLEQWDVTTLKQLFIRVFPFGRGLWEDKVANTWCATNIIIKWRTIYSTQTLQKLRHPPPSKILNPLGLTNFGGG